MLFSLRFAQVVMFPVCTGINRVILPAVCAGRHVPCMHRDKPFIAEHRHFTDEMFPVCTGINRTIQML